MSLNNMVKALPLLFLLASCAKIEGKLGANVHENIKCSVFEVFSDKASIGTGFFLEHDRNVVAITTSHALLSAGKARLSIRPACGQETTPIKSFARLGGLDAAVLYPDKTELVKGIPVRLTETEFSGKLYGLAFPSLQSAEPRFKGLPIPSSGLLIDNSAADILFSLDIVQLGSSGAPIVDGSGNLLGMLTNRVVIDGNYTGVCYGISATTLQSALSNSVLRPAQ